MRDDIKWLTVVRPTRRARRWAITCAALRGEGRPVAAGVAQLAHILQGASQTSAPPQSECEEYSQHAAADAPPPLKMPPRAARGTPTLLRIARPCRRAVSRSITRRHDGRSRTTCSGCRLRRLRLRVPNIRPSARRCTARTVGTSARRLSWRDASISRRCCSSSTACSCCRVRICLKVRAKEAQPARRLEGLLVVRDEPQQLVVTSRCEQRALFHAPHRPPRRRASSAQQSLHSTPMFALAGFETQRAHRAATRPLCASRATSRASSAADTPV